jgi:hypothetical protein
MRYGFSMHSLLSALRPSLHFHLCRSEKEMIQYLKGVGIYANRQTYPLPNLALLDSNHPQGDDLFVLHWIRERSCFRNMPVVILIQGRHTLVKQVFDLGSNACAVMRNDLNSVCEIIDGVADLQPILTYHNEKSDHSGKVQEPQTRKA